MLAGPGTGKTTTLVEAIVDRIEHRGARPDEVLALTFSRKAAEQLRDRVTARLGRTMSTHAELDVPLLRLRPGPALRARRALRRAAAAALRARAGRRAPGAAHRQPRVGALARGAAARRSAPAASPARCTPCSPAPASAASTPTSLVALGREPRGSRSSRRPGCSSTQYLDVLDGQAAIDYPDLIAPRR